MGRPPEAAQLAESELVDLAKTGDVRAYEEVVRRYQGLVFRVAYMACGSREDAEDAAQDTFMKAHRALARFRPGAPLRPWLIRIAANEARNRRTSSRRRAGLPLRLAGMTHWSEEASPLERITLRGGRQELLEALGRLPAKQRGVIAYRYLLDLSEAETAAAVGCRPGTVKSRLSRALAALRDELDEEAIGA